MFCFNVCSILKHLNVDYDVYMAYFSFSRELISFHEFMLNPMLLERPFLNATLYFFMHLLILSLFCTFKEFHTMKELQKRWIAQSKKNIKSKIFHARNIHKMCNTIKKIINNGNGESIRNLSQRNKIFFPNHRQKKKKVLIKVKESY